MLSYREHFQPSEALDEPYAILGCAVVCADSDAEAERLATTLDLNWVRRARGEYAAAREPGGGAAYPYTPIDRERIRQRRARLFVGTPATVRRAARAADRGDQGRRTDGDDDDLRSRRAPAFL